MFGIIGIQLTTLADTSAVSHAMQSVVNPLVATIASIASLACVFFLVVGGIHYTTSAGRPDKLEYAKKIIRNALIGLALIIGAATLTAILSHAYGGSAGNASQHLPTLTAITPVHNSPSLVDVLIKAVTGLLQNIVESIGTPFINALQYFTSATPLIAENSAVFNLWLAIVAMADALFVLIVALLGFNVMSTTTFGLDEIEFKHLLPQLGMIFLLMNSSIFAIDAIISLSNGMISALNAGFGNISVWKALSGVTDQAGGLGVATLLIMVVFIILSVMLMVYYVGRLVTLYLGAVLAPLVLLLWLLPSFKDFASSAAKTYLTLIFVLFVHVVILELAASIFATLIATNPDHTPDPVMALIVGIATLIALLKTQGVLTQLSYASIGPKALRKLGGQFMNSVSYATTVTTKAVPRPSSPSKGVAS
jgi:hypothetical protein